MTTTIEQSFWELLKAGLWGTVPHVDIKLNKEEWKDLMEQAKRQTLLGILFDGMLSLPLEQQPEEEIRLKWFWKVNKIEQANRKQNQVLVAFTEKLQEKGFRALLLKGQSYAALYPNPLHRQSGDIDLYIGRKNYQAICQEIKDRKDMGQIKGENFLHTNVVWQGVDIELHRIAALFSNYFKQRRFVKWGEQMLESSTYTFTPMGQQKNINVPDSVFSSLFVFYHMLFHFFHGGVGLRQLCDWARMLHVYHTEIDQEVLKRELCYYGLMQPWQVFGYILVHQIGLPQEEFPFYKDTYNKSVKVSEDILKQGNFGHYSENKLPFSSNYVIRKGKRYFYHTRRYINTMKLFPSLGFEAFMLFMYERGIHFFTDFFNKK